MDLRKLKTLIDLVSESNISELEITEAEGKVRIVKANPAAFAQAPASSVNAGSAGMALAGAAVNGTSAAAAPSEPAAEPEGRFIKSPMVGTFYRSASPGSKAFVEIGDAVREGAPVCIIEAMKIMNEIESELEGKIARILCENGQAVEFGQPLFAVE